ncbi:MAG: sodium:proton antiporter [candidate division KSB1 bacterium]|nr:sodium:proton antiporter [candidate division KSB1 bacterium]MDZ7365537.1 sodium:proton antiporter [candidate division KSB1 bacterium]MDZ7403640.1 sodium:proton antiporter [candidate division KSB1 bacterium]
MGKSLPLWSSFPFVGILLSIALLPLLAPHFWHHHFGKITAAWALVFAIPFVLTYHGAAMHEILHIYLNDYIPFIIMLWALYTVAGGIFIDGTPVGTPLANTTMLAIGTLIASWVGTTGASMLLIRPMLQMNKLRQRKAHIVVFFIFLVSNLGGALTPLGDPPLFLGFLHGVPFFWTMKLIPEMLVVSAIVLGLFFIFDTIMHRREQTTLPKAARHGRAARVHANPGPAKAEKIRLRGLHNVLLLVGVIGGVLFSGLAKMGEFKFLGVALAVQDAIRDLILIAMGLLSLKFTSKEIREGNGFSWGPIQEVAILFAGIFMTIIPMLAMLKAGTEGALAFIIGAVREPWQYFWVTGSLSSFLDNAPTYLTFLNTALGRFYPGQPELQAVQALIAGNEIYLKAISCGAVFMGANTYIGNAPNFMVKSIAEENGVKMPSFFGYMLYSLLILIPSFTLVTFIFF